jgi:hypothetical protein
MSPKKTSLRIFRNSLKKIKRRIESESFESIDIIISDTNDEFVETFGGYRTSNQHS